MTAARIFLEQTAGKARDAADEPEPIDLQLPPLDSAADCDAAISLITKAVCEGRITHAESALLSNNVQIRLRSLEARVFEQRLADIEAQLKNTPIRDEPLAPPDFAYE